jgi:hypothetical protein
MKSPTLILITTHLNLNLSQPTAPDASRSTPVKLLVKVGLHCCHDVTEALLLPSLRVHPSTKYKMASRGESTIGKKVC